MTTADEVARFTRERREADQRYNDALTALDRAVAAASLAPDDAPAAVSRDECARLATALLVFLQRITAFVESKDREIATNAGARMAAIEQSLAPVAELTAQMGVVQRAVQVLTRTAPRRPPNADAPAEAPAEMTRGSIAPATDYRYVAFEDQYRGSDQAIAERLRAYVPIFARAGAAAVIDLGCGRGELLAALQAAGVRARGVDTNADMVAIARERGLDVVHGDALGYLQSSENNPDETLGGIIATQVIEHLEPGYLMRLLDTASHKLRRGAPIVLETINAACWAAFFGSYIRDLTHVRPIHPETLQYLLRAYGFERVEIRYSAPVPDHVKMRTVDLPHAVAAQGAAGDAVSAALTSLAHAVNVNALVLNNLMFTHLDYAAIGYRA
ncbi:MAG TPA: methyltransferase domain-containing protein [Vicinamibacterales bacterium]|jgi:O-antigen chain-terminating methyltransferase|nr:methyltransferase domain-containing protein [Vicinamibacterales bacterium]